MDYGRDAVNPFDRKKPHQKDARQNLASFNTKSQVLLSGLILVPEFSLF